MDYNISNIIVKFKALPKNQRIVIIIGTILLFGFLIKITGLDKPSACDCKKVMMYDDGAVDAAKRILGGSYGANFMERSQRECGLKYWEDIKKWEENKGLAGTPVDNAMEYFMAKCN